MSSRPTISRCAIFTALLTIVLTFMVPTSADAAGCSGTAYAPPAIKVWQTNYGPPASANNVRSGLKSNFRLTYNWRVEGNVPRTIAVRALGFQKGRQSGSTSACRAELDQAPCHGAW